jgi:Leucine-rich repeat (LRR) protein
MSLTYLFGGRTLEGVKEINDHEEVHNNIAYSFSFSSDSSIASSSALFSYATDKNNSALMLRRLGLSSEEFAHRLFLEAQNDQGYFIELDASRNQVTDIPDSILYRTYLLLTHLNLSCNNLSTISSAILRLSHLQHLNLSENHIEFIPVDMPSCLSQLLVLTLDSNQLQTLPDAIGQWHHLREFRLGSEYGGNRIGQLPNLSDMRHLTELDVSFNQINAIAPHTFDGLHRLRYLNLAHNQLRHMPTLGSCEQLATLDLSDNQLTEIPLGDVWRLTTLQLLNLSNNLIETLPMELLDQEMQTQVVIKGNPLASYEYNYQQQQEEGDTNDDNNRVEESSSNSTSRIQQVVATSDFSSSNELVAAVEEDNSALLSLEEIPNNNGTPILLHSLREIALRALISNNNDDTEKLIPEHIAEDVRNQSQRCVQCLDPFIHEWVTSLQRKSYRGYASVVRQVRFCSTRCWLEYRENLEQQALALQSQVTHPAQQQEEAMHYIAQYSQAMDPASVDWIMAAVMASSAQEEHADIMANYHMFF